MAVIVGIFMCIIFLTFNKSLWSQALICKITWYLEMGKNTKSKNMVLRHRQRGGLAHNPISAPRNWLPSSLPAPNQQGKVVMGCRSMCQYFHQQVLRGSSGLGAGDIRMGPGTDPPEQIGAKSEKCSEGKGQSVMKEAPKSRVQASLLLRGILRAEIWRWDGSQPLRRRRPCVPGSMSKGPGVAGNHLKISKKARGLECRVGMRWEGKFF